MLKWGMRRTIMQIALLLLFVGYGPISAQEVDVSDPQMSLVGNRIHIRYDILNSTSSQTYNVELEVKDGQGRLINASFLSGDIGEGVSGGYGKTIIWEYERDDANLGGDIYVLVYVKTMAAPEPAYATPVKESGGSDMAADRQYSRAGLLLQSVAFPGLGLSKYKGGPHWLKGVVAYGCVAGSVVMNRAAVSTYEGIMEEADLEIKNGLYDQAVTQDNISEILAYTAIAVWVTDLVWTLVGTSGINKQSAYNKGVRINTSMDPYSGVPLLAFTYKF